MKTPMIILTMAVALTVSTTTVDDGINESSTTSTVVPRLESMTELESDPVPKTGGQEFFKNTQNHSLDYCDAHYQVDKVDYNQFMTLASSSDANFPLNEISGPKFINYDTNKDVCGFYVKYGDCETFSFTMIATCQCDMLRSGELNLIVEIVATYEIQKHKVGFVWAGLKPASRVAGPTFRLPEVRVGCPTIRLIRFTSTFQHSPFYLVEKLDTVFIEFEVSGNNSIHRLDGEGGPKIQIDKQKGDKPIIACVALEPSTSTCTNRSSQQGVCMCEMTDTGTFKISYSKTAAHRDSRHRIYMVWPGRPTLYSNEQHIPEIKAAVPHMMTGNSSYNSVLIVISLAVVGLVVTALFVREYRKNGGLADDGKEASVFQENSDGTDTQEKSKKAKRKKGDESDQTPPESRHRLGMIEAMKTNHLIRAVRRTSFSDLIEGTNFSKESSTNSFTYRNNQKDAQPTPTLGSLPLLSSSRTI